MKRFILTLITVLAMGSNCYAAVLIRAANGTYTTKPTLAVAASAADVAGKTVVITTPQTITTAIAWPADRELEFTKAGYVTFSGAGALTGLKVARPEWFHVTGTNDEVPINRAIASLETTGGKVILSQHYNIDTNPILAASGVAITSDALATIGVAAAHIHGGWLHNNRASGGAIVIGDQLHNVEISRIGFRGEAAITPGAATGQVGIEFIVANSTRNTLISQCNFFQIDKCIFVNDPGGDKDVSGVVIEKNQVNECNYFVHTTSSNFESKVWNNDINFFIYGIWLERSNMMSIIGNISGSGSGIATSAFIRAGYVGGILTVMANNAEQVNFPFYFDNSWGPGMAMPLSLIGNIFTGPVTFNGGNVAAVNSIGNRYYDDFDVLAGQVIIESTNDIFDSGKDFNIDPTTNSVITKLTRANKIKYNITGDDNQSNAFVKEFQLTTTDDTVVASLVPWNNAGANTQAFRVNYYFFVINATTNVRIHLAWNDPIGAHDVDLVAAADKTVGSYFGTEVLITAMNGGTAIPIQLKADAGTANNVYVTAIIQPVTY